MDGLELDICMMAKMGWEDEEELITTVKWGKSSIWRYEESGEVVAGWCSVIEEKFIKENI